MSPAARPIMRIGDAPGPAYVCHVCGLSGHRLWRMCVELTCATCSEIEQALMIERYAHFVKEPSFGIGDLVAARPDEEQMWWQHTCGDWIWWLRLPMYQDPVRELARVRLERDHYVEMARYYANEEAKAKGWVK